MTTQENLQKAQERVEKRINTILKLEKKLNISGTVEALHNLNYDGDYLTKKLSKEIICRFVSEKPVRIDDKWNEENYQFNDKIDQLEDNLIKLFEAEKKLEIWKIKFEKEQNRLNMEKIPAIWNFLTEWEIKTIDWYKENSKKYLELKDKEQQEFENYKNSEKGQNDFKILCNYRKWSQEYYFESEWKKSYYSNIDLFTRKITNTYYKTIDEELLTKTIAKEKLNKYIDLIERVTKVIGKITDASYLSIGNKNGELNGIIKGENGKVRIETISAGGYNIQCFHYRVLIHNLQKEEF